MFKLTFSVSSQRNLCVTVRNRVSRDLRGNRHNIAKDGSSRGIEDIRRESGKFPDKVLKPLTTTPLPGGLNSARPN